MAYEKQHWKDTLQTAKPERSRQDGDADKREQKKKSRLMYNRRILEKNIKQYIKTTSGGFKYEDIERIGKRNGFFVN